MSKIYQIKINSRTYDEWYYTDLLENKVDIHYDPISHKLFNNDIVMEVLCDTSNTAIQTQRIKVVDSVISKNKNIPGILILKENKTYGRLERKDTLDLSGSAIKKTPGKLLYKCIPDDKTLPPFLIPYEFKHSNFSKLYSNLYVTFSFSKWGEKDKHPIGVLTNVIGEVNNSNIDIYYSYQLMCKNLNISIEQFNKALFNSIKTRFDSTTVDLNKITNEFISSQYPELENRTDQKEWNIFTIDSVNTTDYDDAFSIKKMGSSETSETYMLSIYISNVALWLELFGLWDVFSNRVSSIYLPDKKITMLPTLMSSNLCSLIENAHRYAFTMDIKINVITYDFTNEKDIMIENIEFKNTIVSVSHNYSYQQEGLISNSNYNSLFDVTKLLSEKYVCQYDITDSNHMVAYLMILMNYYSAKNLKKNNTGILLKNNITTMQKSFELGLGLQNKPNNFVKSWYLSKSEYFGVMNKIDTSSNSQHASKHESLQFDAYTHITSPIRRIVDLLNLIEMQQIHDLFTFSKEAWQFYNKWTSEDHILFINTNMKSIRKLQNECTLLDMFNNIPEIIEKTFNGVIIDIKNNIGSNNTTVYMVYVPELKITCKITKQTTKNYELYNQIKCKLYMFPDEYNIKQKIRLEEVVDV